MSQVCVFRIQFPSDRLFRSAFVGDSISCKMLLDFAEKSEPQPSGIGEEDVNVNCQAVQAKKRDSSDSVNGQDKYVL